MRIALPSFSGLKELPSNMKEIVKVLEELGRNLVDFTSKGIITSDNLSTEVIRVINEDALSSWIEVKHSLKRQPIGFVFQSGGPGYVLDSELREKTCRFLLSGGVKVTLVLL